MDAHSWASHSFLCHDAPRGCRGQTLVTDEALFDVSHAKHIHVHVSTQCEYPVPLAKEQSIRQVKQGIARESCKRLDS